MPRVANPILSHSGPKSDVLTLMISRTSGSLNRPPHYSGRFEDSKRNSRKPLKRRWRDRGGCSHYALPVVFFMSSISPSGQVIYLLHPSRLHITEVFAPYLVSDKMWKLDNDPADLKPENPSNIK